MKELKIERIMKKKILNILKIVAFITIGVVLFWLVYRKQDIESIKTALLESKKIWLLVSVLLGLMSHISRAVRWKILIKPMGYNPKIKNLFFSVMIMYLTNFAIPRSGEFVRCGLISKYENIPFSKLLGTVIAERVVDMLILMLLTIVMILTQYSVVIDFINEHPETKETITNLLHSAPLILSIIGAGILFLTLIIIFRKKIKSTAIYKKIHGFVKNFIDGFISIKNIKEKRFAFFLHSIFIWQMYYAMTYICFWSFDFTAGLSLLNGLSVFVMTAFGMVIPSPGGMGSWHFIAQETLFLFDIPKAQGLIYAFAAHESQLIMLVVVGLFSLIAIPFFNRKQKDN